MSDYGVRVDRDGPVATVTLCRPRVLNAQTPQMWDQLRRIGRELPADVRVVVVRGQGRAFSAGLDLSVVRMGSADGSDGSGRPEGPGAPTGSVAPTGSPTGSDRADAPDEPPLGGSLLDLAAMARLDDAAATSRISEFQQAFGWLRQPHLVSLAAVQGHAVGAGFQLALAADLRVLAEDASLRMAEVKLGLVPDLGGTKRLVELVGYSRALEICVTGRPVDADEAYRIGLANVVVPVGQLDKAVDELVAMVLASPRDAVIEIKSLLLGAGSNTFAEQEQAERAAQLRRIRDLVGLGE